MQISVGKEDAVAVDRDFGAVEAIQSCLMHVSLRNGIFLSVVVVGSFLEVSVFTQQPDESRRSKGPERSAPNRNTLSPEYPLREFIYLGDELIATDAGSEVPPSAPFAVAAERCYVSRVVLRWFHDGGATGFTIQRKQGAGSFQSLTPSPPLVGSSRQYFDGGLAANTTYTYRIRAEGQGGSSGYSPDFTATTSLFSDGVITPGVTVVRGAHMEELRAAVNAVRACADLEAFTGWAHPSPLAGNIIRGIDIQELRTQLQPTWSPLGLSEPVYTDGPGLAGVTIKAIHLTELRNAVQ